MFTERSLTLAVSRRRKRRRSAAEPKLEAVGSSAWLGASAAAPPHMWKELGQRRALCAILPWRGLGGCAASHVEGSGAAPGALGYPALEGPRRLRRLTCGRNWGSAGRSVLSCLGGASAAAPPHMWKELGQRRALCAILPWRGLGGCAASHVEGTGAAPGALCYPAL